MNLSWGFWLNWWLCNPGCSVQVVAAALARSGNSILLQGLLSDWWFLEDAWDSAGNSCLEGCGVGFVSKAEVAHSVCPTNLLWSVSLRLCFCVLPLPWLWPPKSHSSEHSCYFFSHFSHKKLFFPWEKQYWEEPQEVVQSHCRVGQLLTNICPTCSSK